MPHNHDVGSARFDEDCIGAGPLGPRQFRRARFPRHHQNRDPTRHPIASKDLTQRETINDRQPQFGDDHRRGRRECAHQCLASVGGFGDLPADERKRHDVQFTIVGIAIDDEHAGCGDA